ncbi:MAG: hypothetical protein C0599_07890 [Salinivirgaceae bacterium]|nr:MAG: hypothetical protein C0599_07890 [Salinivirgaceae bacterium]
MENNIKERYGSLRKIEPLKQITDDSIVPGTLAFECPAPYPGYYNMQEKQTVPLFVYFILEEFMHLDDFLAMSEKVICEYGENCSATLASIVIDKETFFAIRVKYIEDYAKLRKLHEVYAKYGVGFKKASKKYGELDDVQIRIKKFFKMSVLEDGFYCDKMDEHHGYFEISESLTMEEFVPIAKKVKYNIDAVDFDAALAFFYEDFKVHKMIRIYTSRISLEMLKKIKVEYDKLINKLHK